MPEIRAILFIRPGIEQERQWAMCLEYADRHDYRIIGIANAADAVLALARSGAATVVVAAYADRRAGDDAQLHTQLDDLNCRLEHVRPRRSPMRPADGSLIAGMYARGGSVQQLAHLLDVDPAAIRQELTASRTHLRPADRPADELQ